MTAFTDWLERDEAERVLLVEAKRYDDSAAAEVTTYLASRDFVSKPADTPANQQYLGVIVGSPWFEWGMSGGFGGPTFISNGELEIENGDGAYDDWLEDGWDGRDITLLLGDPSWDRDQFEAIHTGIILRLEVKSESRLAIVLQDRMALLDIVIPTNIYTSSDPLAEGSPKPLCYGRCENVTPVATDNLEWQVHDGAVEDAADHAYVNGVDNPITKDNGTGKVSDSIDQGGARTLDCQGAKPSGIWLQTMSQIIRDLVSRIGPLADPGDLDTSAFSQFATDMPYLMGLYIESPTNLIDAIQSLHPMGWHFGMDRTGKFYCRVIKDPAGETSVYTLDDFDTIGDVSLVVDELPPTKKIMVGVAKCWTVQRSVDGAQHTERAFVTQEWRYAEYADASIVTKHKAARVMEPVLTLIRDQDVGDRSWGGSDGVTEATRLHGLYGTQRRRYKGRARLAAMQFDVGDTITLKDRRFGLSAGKKLLVVAMKEYFLDDRVELELWG